MLCRQRLLTQGILLLGLHTSMHTSMCHSCTGLTWLALVINHQSGLLRDEWGWDGFVVTDYGAFEQIYTSQGCGNKGSDPARCCSNVSCAALAGMRAGLDQDGGGTACVDEIPDLVSAGSLSPGRVELSFRRLMKARLELGMFDPPAEEIGNSLPFSAVESQQHLSLARRAGQKAICLYQNRGNVLPLSAADFLLPESSGSQRGGWRPHRSSSSGRGNGGGARLLVAGYTANDGDNLQGNYAQHTDLGGESASILAGISHALGKRGVSVLPWSSGAGIAAGAAEGTKAWSGGASTGSTNSSSVLYIPGCSAINCPETNFSTVTAHGRLAKVSVVVLGTIHNNKNNDSAWTDCGPADVTGVSPTLPVGCEMEGHDRSSAHFAGHQVDLAAALSKARTGNPLVCILVHGGSMLLGDLRSHCDAILDAWQPGGQGGHAVADVLFGAVSPAGRSPQTWYPSESSFPPHGEMHLYPNASTGNRGWTYRYNIDAVDVGRGALPFGFGLSYTTFKYSHLTITAPSAASKGDDTAGTPDAPGSATKSVPVVVGPCDAIRVVVTVSNIGAVDSDEVVQLYLQQQQQQQGLGFGVPAAAGAAAVAAVATVAPRIRLAAFSRVHVPAGQSVAVVLQFGPKQQAVVPAAGLGSRSGPGPGSFWEPQITVPAGVVGLFVGGGQPGVATSPPQADAGAGTEGLDMATPGVWGFVNVSRAAALTRSYACLPPSS